MNYSDTKVLFERNSISPYRQIIIKVSVTAVKRILKPFLLLLIFLLWLWFVYTRYQAFELQNSKVYVTTTPHQPILKSDLDYTTLSINESIHKITEKTKLERKEKVQMEIEPKPMEPRASTAQSTHIEIELNFSLKQQNIQEQKPNHTVQLVHYKTYYEEETTIKSEIEYDIKSPIYYDDDLHPDWVFNISRTYDAKYLHRWTKPMRKRVESKRWTRGDYGMRFIPKDVNESAIINKLTSKHNFNLYASDHMSVRRNLRDYRCFKCRNLVYPNRLPTVSIIIIMYNEAWSMILRTIWSIIDRSPRELLHEIILVDDASTFESLKRPLDDYIERFPANVSLIRNQKREGLIRARLIGAEKATGTIMIFLDAHMECTEGWLEPLVARIANDRSVVAVPLIDFIHPKDMHYIAPSASISMFRWNLIFNWVNVPERELLRTHYDPTAPLRTPTHVGCAFAIDREFFYEIGSYDKEMDIWGSENIELAFRVWMCGGSLEIVSCSRVGHLFRHSTYSFDGDRHKITMRNNLRVVEVWMDEFKELFYAANHGAKDISPGNLDERKLLRQRLKCKSFRWYLENIYPESNLLKEYITMGEVHNDAMNLCLDQYTSQPNNKLLLWRCQKTVNQFFAFAKSGQITISEGYCIGVKENNNTRIDGVYVVKCSDTDPTQLWIYDSEQKWIVHKESGVCMQGKQTKKKAKEVILAPCDPLNNQFDWTLKSTMRKKMNETPYEFPDMDLI